MPNLAYALTFLVWLILSAILFSAVGTFLHLIFFVCLESRALRRLALPQWAVSSSLCQVLRCVHLTLVHHVAWWLLQVTTVVSRYAKREPLTFCRDYAIFARPKY